MSVRIRRSSAVVAALCTVTLAIPSVAMAEPVAPTVTITSAPATPGADNTPAFRFTAAVGTTAECSLVPTGDEPSYGACVTPYQATALADGDWVFSVQVTDAGGLTGTDEHAFTVDTTTDAPQVQAEALGASHVQLTWEPVSDPAGPVTYDVLRGGEVLAGGLTDPAYDDRWAPPGADLTYGVRATDDLGNVSDLATVAVSTPAAELPGAPEDVAVAADGRRITVTWAAPADTGGTWLDDYQVTLTEKSSGVTFTRYVHRLKTSSTFSGLRTGRTYRATVSAANAAGAGPAAASAWLLLRYTPPAAPVMAEAASGSPRDRGASVAVSWTTPDASDGVPVTGYRVTAVNSSGRRYTTWTSASSRTAELTWLKSGATYRLYVQAYNRGGYSPPSDWSNPVVAR